MGGQTLYNNMQNNELTLTVDYDLHNGTQEKVTSRITCFPRNSSQISPFLAKQYYIIKEQLF